MANAHTDLHRCPVFEQMSDEERHEVLSLLEYESFPQHETILQEGNETQFLWILVRGQCEVAKRLGRGIEQEIAVLEAGTVFGEMSFFNPAPHSATIRALTQVETARLSREKFDALQRRSPAAAYKVAVSIVTVLARRLRRMDEWTCELVDAPDAARQREEWQEFRTKLYTDWKF